LPNVLSQIAKSIRLKYICNSNATSKNAEVIMSTNQEKFEKILGEPFAMDFSDYVRKIRNGLIITSIISIALLLGELRIAPDSTFLGLKFTGLTNNFILHTLFYINAYHLYISSGVVLTTFKSGG
jgi:hypothetical protein